MKFIRYLSYGEPDAVVEIAETESPRPGPNEIVIALEAAPVHLADIKNITGQPWFRAPLPATPGYEGVGRVTSVGADVSGLGEGDRVFLPTGLGTWREEFVAPADGIWRAPEGVPAEQLALISINLQTAYLMLVEANLSPGDWVIQNAANSNVGFYVIRLARQMGFKTINVARRPEVLDSLLAAGGDHAIVDGGDLASRVERLGADVRLAIDAVGGAATARLAGCVGMNGKVVNYGFLSGDTCEISAQQMMFRQLTLSGFFTKASLARMSRQAVDEMREVLSSFVVTDAPSAPIAGIYSFADVHKALRHAALTEGERQGKVVLVP